MSPPVKNTCEAPIIFILGIEEGILDNIITEKINEALYISYQLLYKNLPPKSMP